MAKAAKKVATPKLNVKTEAKKPAEAPVRKETSKTKFAIVAVVGLVAAFGVHSFVSKWTDQKPAPKPVATAPAPKAEVKPEVKAEAPKPSVAVKTLSTGKYVTVYLLPNGTVEKRTGGSEDWRARKANKPAGRITTFASESAYKKSLAPAAPKAPEKRVDNGWKFWTAE
jgi:hypothetical protein